MAIPFAALAALAGAGGVANTLGNVMGGRRANQSSDTFRKMLTGMFQTGPGNAEQMLMSLFGMGGGGMYGGGRMGDADMSLPRASGGARRKPGGSWFEYEAVPGGQGSPMDFNSFSPEQWGQYLNQGAAGGGMMGGSTGGLPAWLQPTQVNMGQDGLMQILRGSGGAGRTLDEMATTGTPFDMSTLFKSLEPLENRMLDESMAGLFGSFAGPGQRYGSAAMREGSRMRGEHLENAAARRAGIAQQSFESAAGRRLGAAGMLGGFAGQADELGLRAQMANQTAGQESIRQLLASLGLMQGMEQGRMGQNMGLAGMFGGVPANTSALGAVGGGMTDLAQLLYLFGGEGGAGKRSKGYGWAGSGGFV